MNLTISTVGNGIVIPPSTTFEYDESLAIKAMPDAGWTFVNWTGDIDKLVDSDAAFTNIINPVYDDITIQANFSQ